MSPLAFIDPQRGTTSRYTSMLHKLSPHYDILRLSLRDVTHKTSVVVQRNIEGGETLGQGDKEIFGHNYYGRFQRSSHRLSGKNATYVGSSLSVRARRFPLAEPLLHERDLLRVYLLDLSRLSGPVRQSVLHVAQHSTFTIVMMGTYLVPVMHSARNQNVRPFSRALPRMRAIRTVHRRRPPRVLFSVDEGKAVACDREAAILVHGRDVRLGGDAVDFAGREGLCTNGVSTHPRRLG
jgi:hypothetical protein